MSDIPPPFDAPWFLFLIGALLGAALGSFGTMLAYRLPRHLSIIHPGSHCPSCRTLLQVGDLVPLVSWMWTKGQCRYCHARIGSQYIWIEMVTALACGVVTIFIGFSLWLIPAYSVILTLIVIIRVRTARP